MEPLKKLEELGISPSPWKEQGWATADDYGHEVLDYHHKGICDMRLMQGETRVPNARLIAAAPDMYDAIWDMLFKCTKITNCRNCKGHELGNCDECPLGKARAALEKAGGV